MSQKTEQLSCECGKQFNNRNDLEKHRQTCATAQASGGQKVRSMGGDSGSSNE